MAKNIKLPDEVNKKIDKAINEILNVSAERLAKDCKEQYIKVITDFYSHYKPRSYNRSFETRSAHNLRDDDYKKITNKINDTSIQVKFRISADYIEGNPYRADKNWVFDRTFDEGIHGWTPEEVLDYTGGANYGYYGRNGKFYINKMMYWHDVPKPFSPSPRERMDEWYKQYKMPTNLRKILQPISREIMKKYL